MCSVTQPLWYYLLLSVGRDKMGCRRLMTVLLLKQWKVWITGNHLQVKDRAVVITSCVVFCCYCTGAAHQATVHEFLMSPMCVDVKEQQPRGSVWSTPENRGSPWCIRPEQTELPSSYKPEGKEMANNSCRGVLQPSPRKRTWKYLYNVVKIVKYAASGIQTRQPCYIRGFGSWSQSVNWQPDENWRWIMSKDGWNQN